MRARRLSVVVASGAIALGAAGFAAYPAFADETPSDPPTSSATPTPGEEGEKSRPDRVGEALKGLVEDGTITQEQADKVAERLAESDLRGGGPHTNFRMGGPFGVALDEVAEALGLTRDELQEGLADGKSVKELAEAQGKDADTVVDALVAAAGEQIDKAVEDERLSQEDADELKSGLRERIADVVENGLPKLPGLGERGEKGGDGPGFRHWHDERADQGEPGNDATPEPSAPENEESSYLGVA